MTDHAIPVPSAVRGPNLAEVIGQVVWVLSQSPTHRRLRIQDVERSIFPGLVSGQCRIFHLGVLPDNPGIDWTKLGGLRKAGLENMPLGVALWARLSEAAEAKLDTGDPLTPEEWNSGDRLWLVELISPFATAENKLTEIMLLDLIKGPFKGERVRMHRVDAATGSRVVHVIEP